MLANTECMTINRLVSEAVQWSKRHQRKSVESIKFLKNAIFIVKGIFRGQTEPLDVFESQTFKWAMAWAPLIYTTF